MRRAYAMWSVLALAVLILVVEGYLGYQYYNRYYGQVTASSSAAVEPEGPKVSRTTGVAEEEAALVHRATSENIVRNSTYIDDPSVNGNPDAILLVTQIWEPGVDVADAHPVGVWYDANRGGRWAIFNQDLAPMPEGATFSVVVLENSEQASIHRAKPANTVDNVTYLSHPLANGNPEAILSVTPSWNPGGIGGIYNDHPVGTQYDAGKKRWGILNHDLAPMPRNAAFNVLVSDSSN